MLCLNRSVFISSLFQVQFVMEPYLDCYQICYLPCHFYLTAPDGTDLTAVQPTAAIPTCTCLLGYCLSMSIFTLPLMLCFSSPAGKLIHQQCHSQRLPPTPCLFNLEIQCAIDHMLLWHTAFKLSQTVNICQALHSFCLCL